MKRLLLLLAVACVGFVSCSETLNTDNPNEGPSQLEELQKRFDFSEVDTDNLRDIHEESRFNTDDLTVITGVSNDDCLWLGVFDSQSGSLKCQYTDEDHPAPYFAYGEEHKYEVGKIIGAYLDNDKLVVVIQYAEVQYENLVRSDLVSITEDSHYRYILDEKSRYISVSSIMKWTDSSIYILLNGTDTGEKGIIYDVEDNIILSCAIDFWGIIKDDYHNSNLIVSPSNALHFWRLSFCLPSGDLAVSIVEYQCTYDTISSTRKNVTIYDQILGNNNRYSHEYEIRTNDHILAIFTQLEYDGTATTKSVDIRVEDDELKVDIQ